MRDAPRGNANPGGTPGQNSPLGGTELSAAPGTDAATVPGADPSHTGTGSGEAPPRGTPHDRGAYDRGGANSSGTPEDNPPRRHSTPPGDAGPAAAPDAGLSTAPGAGPAATPGTDPAAAPDAGSSPAGAGSGEAPPRGVPHVRGDANFGGTLGENPPGYSTPPGGADTAAAPGAGPAAAPGAEPARAGAGSGGASPRGAYDVLVVGGGIIGLVTAWRAAQRGLRVAVADPEPGGGAARVAAGMLAAVTELQYGEQTLLDLNLVSAARYPDFAAELTEATGLGTGFRACGTLAVALDADDRAHLRDLHAFQTSLGLSSEWLSGRDCRRLEPLLAPGVRGGLRVDGDHQVDPRRLAAALLRAAELAGAVLHRCAVARVRTTSGGRVTGALLADGTEVAAGRTVLAAGSRSGRIAGVPEAALPPVRPVKGQILRLRIPAGHAPFLSRTVRAVVRGSHVYLVPRENGELVLGATSEECGWDTTVTAGGVYELLRDAHELVPGITELPLTETLAGLRPGSPDNAPLLGRTAVDGLLLATGHHRNGVLLTPVTGDIMAEVLVTGELPGYARPFAASRFGPGPGTGTGTGTGNSAAAAPAVAAREEQPV
jgi:glycine oxidase